VSRATSNIDKHGERIAYQKEKERLVEAGFDPAQVKWESEHNELAPVSCRLQWRLATDASAVAGAVF